MAPAFRRPALDIISLEERCCPTASVFAQNHVLYITTDFHSDIVQIRDNGQGQMTVTVRDDEGIQRLNAGGINQVILQLRGEHDWVDISSSAPLGHSLSVQADMGQGADDRLFVEMNKGLGTGSLSIGLFGTLGNSVVDARVGPLGSRSVDIQQHLADVDASSDLHIGAFARTN